MKLSKKFKGIAIASVTVFSGIGVVTASLAWFIDMVTYSFEQVDLQANSGGAYFAYGAGTDANPYGISSPRHLYNLAWMQYLGMFDDKQYHFELANDVDMTGYYLPPIGTETHPFLGEFDGKGKSVIGLTVTNSYSEYTGYSKAPDEVTSSNFVAPEIVGFFGVVGKLPNTSTSYTYNSSANTFVDTTLESITINGAGTTKLLTGLAAGYASGTLQGVNVDGDSTIKTNGQTATEFTSKLTDYGLVGYTTHEASNGTYSQQLSEYYDGETGGEGSEWGGSVTMKNMYNRLYDIADTKTTSTTTYGTEMDIVTRANGTTFERKALNTKVYKYRDREEGSFVFSAYSSSGDATGDWMYLNGGRRYHQIKQTETQVSNGFTIKYDNRYLGVNSSGSIANTASAWLLSDGKLYTVVNGIAYYFTHSRTAATSTSDTWIKSGNTLYYETKINIIITITRQNYLYYSSGWKTSTSSKTLTFETATATKITESSNGPDYMDYTGTDVTYFPLITEASNYNVTAKNTGYVIGGCEDHPNPYPYKTGDIRVSKYKTSDISNSYTSANGLQHVYTINSSGSRVEITNNNSSYEKYTESRAGLLDMISDGNIYGLHFMPANISSNHLVTAEYTLVNGQEKEQYEMPASSIDFNLLEKGIVNFFAGTYYTNNNSFFSLHEIFRDGNDKISEIKEIKEIYRSTNSRKNYIYKYTDNSTTGTITNDYSLAFATSQIKVQSSVITKAVYYYEIPMNSGEYALGSVDGGIGAYLMYLDIGTNGTPPDPVHAYWINTISAANIYPIGVDFCPVGVEGNGGESFGIYIASGKSGSITFGVTTGNVNITDTSSVSTYSFKGTKYTDSTSPTGGVFNVSGNSPGALVLPSAGGTRVLMIYVTTVLNNKSYVIRITDHLTNAAGDYNASQSTYEIDDGTGFEASDVDTVENLSAQIRLNTFRALKKVATLTKSSGSQVFTTTYDRENSYYNEKIIDVDIEKNDTTIDIEVTSGYTFKIGGTIYANGSTY